MRLLIAFLLFLICGIFTLATSKGYMNYEGLVVDVILTAILIPSMIALPFCLPKSGRNFRRFLKAYNIALLFVILLQVKDLPINEERPIASTGNANNPEASNNVATNKISNGKFAIFIPSTWVIYVPNGGKEDYIAKIESEANRIEMYIGYDNNNTSPTLEEYALSLENRLRSNISGDITTSNLTDCNVKGVECLYKVFNVDNGDRDITSAVASFGTPHGYYRVSMNTLTPLWEMNNNAFFETIRSFRVL